MIAYHYLMSDMTASSGNEPAWSIGEKRTLKGRLKLCEFGYHSSPTPWAGLEYARGPILCQVEISTPPKKCQDNSKQCSRSRQLLKAIEVSRELRIFACDCAERALAQVSLPDRRSLDAIMTARRFANGQATLKELSAAYAAADAAAYAAADAAAYAADAAAYAATAVANAAYAAAFAAANATEHQWQQNHFNKLMLAKLEETQ